MGSCYAWTTSVSVTVMAAPTAPTLITGTTTICAGGSTTLTATGGSEGSGCTYQWYAGGCGSGTVLETTSSLPVSPSTTTTYYVRRVGTSPCNNTITSCASVTVTVSDAINPGDISAVQDVCYGETPTELTGIAPTGGLGAFTYQWQQDPNCTGAWSNISGETSANYQPGSLTANTCYRRMVSNTCGTAYSTAETPSDGLVLHYTFDDVQEPTTNLLPLETVNCDGGMSGYWSGTIETNNYDKGVKSFKVTTLNDTYYNGFISSQTANCTEGTVYTFSLRTWIPAGREVVFRIYNLRW